MGPHTGMSTVFHPIPSSRGLPACSRASKLTEVSPPPLILHTACRIVFLKHRSDHVTLLLRRFPEDFKTIPDLGTTDVPSWPHSTPLPVTNLNAIHSKLLHLAVPYFVVGRPFPFPPHLANSSSSFKTLLKSFFRRLSPFSVFHAYLNYLNE